MKVSHVEKVWFPKTKITKQNIIDYYNAVSKYFLNHVKNHPIVLQRFPNGIHHDSFYQKQVSDYFPSFIKNTTIQLKTGGKQTLVILHSKKSLQYLVNQATLVFHSWLSSTTAPNVPDKIVFDLDPSTNDLTILRFGARTLKKIIESHNLKPFLMTTGSRGYHIVIPIIPEHSFEKTHAFAKEIAEQVATQYPDHFTITPTKSKRKGKVFIDYLRNSYGQTSVAPYSVRAQEGAPIATPIDWSELSRTTPQKYTIKNIFKRLSTKGDMWKDFRKYAKLLKI